MAKFEQEEVIKFLRELNRMCREECDYGCPICETTDEVTPSNCGTWLQTHPEIAADYVAKWAADHPAATRQTEFLKQFPNAGLDSSGTVCICPRDLDTRFVHQCVGNRDVNMSCEACRGRWWSREMGMSYDAF